LQADPTEIINLHRPLERESDDWSSPHCGVVEKSTPAHTLEHLDSIANRASLVILPQDDLIATLKGGFRTVVDPTGTRDLRKTLSLREAGERIRVAMETTKNAWMVYELAALYWQIRGRAPECIECLQNG
jgi:hypothetical protein